MAFSTLSIGTTALLTARYGLDITGQNLGNVDTAGYSRQRLSQVATVGRSHGANNLIVGNGVWAKSVTRIASEHVEKQLRQATTTDEYYGGLTNAYANVQSFFNELTGNALSDSMSQFWSAMNDFSAKVENIPVRSTTMEEARQLTTRFNKLGNQLDQYRADVDKEVEESVKQINRLLNNIAELNRHIVASECGGVSNSTANDLRDQRGDAVKELAKYMDVDVVEEDNGAYIVSMHGRNLVYFDQAKEIKNIKTMSPDGTMVNTPAFASDGEAITPWDGLLAAQMEIRDTIIPSYKNNVDTLAGNFIWQFNRAHSQTIGLESFSTLTSQNGPKNPWDTLDAMDWGAKTAEGTFKIENGNFQIIIHNRNTNEPTTVNIEVDLDGRPNPQGEPDAILWDPNDPDASHALINRMQKALDEALPGVFSVSIDRDYKVTITSKSSDYGFAFGEDTSGVLAALGLNTFFTGFNSTDMGINQELVDNPALIGGATSFEAGDNDGVVSLLDVRDEESKNMGDMTLEDYYLAITGRLASESNSAANMKALSCDIQNRMFNQRESLSGVNEDEEVSKLITYQRAFQAAAKFISTVDQIYETLINM